MDYYLWRAYESTQLYSQSNSHIHTWPLGKTIALTRQTFVGKVMSLLFKVLYRLVITFLQLIWLEYNCKLSFEWQIKSQFSALILALGFLKSGVSQEFECSLHRVQGSYMWLDLFWKFSLIFQQLWLPETRKITGFYQWYSYPLWHRIETLTPKVVKLRNCHIPSPLQRLISLLNLFAFAYLLMPLIVLSRFGFCISRDTFL